MKKGAGEGWSCRFWLKACELFVYLNLRFRSYQFEEQVLSSQTFIRSDMAWICDSTLREKSPFVSIRIRDLMIAFVCFTLSFVHFCTIQRAKCDVVEVDYSTINFLHIA